MNIFSLIKEINKKLPTHWGFFGPSWFCWLLVFIGAQVWLIEPSLKSLGLYEYGPFYNIVNLTAAAFDSNNYLIFSILVIFLSMSFMTFIVFFPSFWVLTTNIVSSYMTNGYQYIAMLLFPFWFNFLFYRLIKLIH